MAKEQAEGKKRISHDNLFKEFLQRFLPEFLELFFPEKAAQLDFEQVLFFSDKELVFNLPQRVQRITDIVAEVKTQAGEPEVVLLHVEVEARKKAPLPQRMFEYYSFLRMLRQKPVLPLALVLLPNSKGLIWKEYTEELFGETLVRFRYGQVGLLDLSAEEYLATANPIAAALAALMKPSDKKQKAKIKLMAWRTVANSNLTEGDKMFLMNIIATYLPKEELPAEIEEETVQALAEMEMTWLDRALYQGRQEGRQEGQQTGKVEGKRDILLYQLQAKFGEVSQDVQAKIDGIAEHSLLDQLSLQILTANSLAELSLPNGEAA